MNKDQLRFLFSGILFGFLVGYVVAYAVYEPRVVQHAAPVPAAGNMGMGSGAPPSASAGPGGEQMMAQVFEEIAALKETVERDPKNGAALIRLANMFHDAGKYQEAVAYYERALKEIPGDVNARTDMGICLREMGRTDDAIAQFRTSLSTDPRHWQTWLNLGIVSLFDKQDLKTAAEAFGKVEELNPTYQDLPLLKQAVEKARRPSQPPGA